MRARRDPAHVRRPRARREAPRRSRRQLEQRFQLAPAVATIIAPKQPARLGARVHRPVGRAHRKREDTRLGKRTVDPAASAVPRPAYPVRTQTRIQRVRVERVNRKALRPAPGQQELAHPPVTGLVKANDPVPGRGVKSCHRPRALTQEVPRSKPRRPSHGGRQAPWADAPVAGRGPGATTRRPPDREARGRNARLRSPLRVAVGSSSRRLTWRFVPIQERLDR